MLVWRSTACLLLALTLALLGCADTVGDEGAIYREVIPREVEVRHDRYRSTLPVCLLEVSVSLKESLSETGLVSCFVKKDPLAEVEQLPELISTFNTGEGRPRVKLPEGLTEELGIPVCTRSQAQEPLAPLGVSRVAWSSDGTRALVRTSASRLMRSGRRYYLLRKVTDFWEIIDYCG